jgi:protein-S-isoprenylcysteine O-methyltransferase Ste14
MENPEMTPPKEHSVKLRRRVILLFFSGLLLMAALAVGIGWACAHRWRILLGWPNQVVGPILLFGGIALVVWSVNIQFTLGKGTPAPRVATQRLVTQGPYAYTRNPMTLGALLIYLGIGVWIGSGVVIILTVIVFSGLLVYIYHHETGELTGRFGEEYLDYMRRTPFLLPRCPRRR